MLDEKKTKKQLIDELKHFRSNTKKIEKDILEKSVTNSNSLALWKNLYKESPYMLYIHDLKGNFIDANDKALKLLKYNRDEIRSLNFEKILTGNNLKKAHNSLVEIINTGFQNKTQEYKIIKKNGDPLFIEAFNSLIFKKNKPVAVQGIARKLDHNWTSEEFPIEAVSKKSETSFINNDLSASIGKLAVQLSEANTLDDIFKNVITAIKNHTNLSDTAIYRVDNKIRNLELLHKTGKILNSKNKTITCSINNRIKSLLKTFDPTCISNSISTDISKYILQNKKIKASAVSPVIFRKKTIAILISTSESNMIISNETKKFFKSVSALLSLSYGTYIEKIELKESKNKYLRIANLAANYSYRVIIQDGKYHRTLHEKNCKNITGYSLEDFNSNPDLWINMIPDEDKKVVNEHASKMLSGQAPMTIRHRINRKDGEKIWVKNFSIPLLNDKGEVIAYDAIIHDITKEINNANEQKLNRIQSESLYRLSQLYDEPENIIFEFALHTAMQLTSSKAGHIFLVDHEENSIKLNHISQEPKKTAIFKEAEFSKSKQLREAVCGKKPLLINDFGTNFFDQAGCSIVSGTLNFLGVPLIENKRPVVFICVANKESDFDLNDIQRISIIMHAGWRIIGKKRLDQSLISSEKNLNEAQTIAHMGNWVWNLKDNKLTWSNQIYSIFEMDPSSIKASYEAFLSKIHPDDKDNVLYRINQALDNNAPYCIEHRIICSDGKEKVVQEKGIVERDRKNNAAKMNGTVQDITERKMLEEELEAYRKTLEKMIEKRTHELTLLNQNLKSEIKIRKTAEADLKKWARIFEHVGWGIAVCNYDTKKMEMLNPVFAQMHGYSPMMLIDQPILEIVAPDERQNLLVHFRESLHNEHYSYESRHMRQDGSDFPVLVNVATINDSKNESLYQIFNVQDITERKQYEESLIESEELFRHTFDQAPVAAALISLEGSFQKVNKELCNITGFSENELRNMKIEDIIHPDFMGKDKKLTRKILEGKIESYQGDRKYLRKDGQIIWGRTSVQLIHDAENAPMYFLPMIEDITEKKISESKLLESEKRYRILFENNPDGIIITDINTNKIILANPSISLFLGYSIDELMNMTSADLLIGHDLKTVIAACDSNRDGWYKTSCNVTCKKKDGSIIYTDISSALTRSEDNKYIATVFRVKQF